MNISARKWLLISIIVAFLSRSIIFFSSPFMVSTSDSGSWISFALEIHQAGMSIPALNAIHYPGSEYIYPPVIPYLLMALFMLTGFHGLSPFYSVTILEIVIGGFTAIPVFLTVREKFGLNPAIFSSIVYGLFSPFLYLISFSSLPQEAGFFIILWIVYLIQHFLADDRNLKTPLLAIFLLSFLLNFVHDLSTFFFLAAITFYIFYTIFYSVFENKSGRKAVYVSSVSLAGSVAGFLVWYVPRIRWVMQGISLYGNRASVSSAFSIFLSDIKNLAQPVAIPTFMGYLSIIFPILALFLLLLSIRAEKGSVMSPVTFFLLMSFVLTAVSSPFPVIFVRLSYFLALFYSVSSGVFVFFMGSENQHQVHGIFSSLVTKARRHRKKVLNLIIILIILYSAWGIVFSSTAHSYYLSEDCSDFSTVHGISQWILANEGRSEVIAASGGTGYFLMGYTGNPVLDYVNQSFLSQITEINQSKAAHIITACPLDNASATLSLIERYNVSLVVTYLNISSVPVFYSPLFAEGDLRIYSV